ncbi:g12446 [Coccomyxa viridis]|uniref:G12446 protein n=1 Tax=Coccomyxa viridis TaxID=1274662 RepID=A0ABP1GAD1_9CHLO
MTQEDVRPKKLIVHVPEDDIDDLKSRLSRTRWPGELEGIGWEYGAKKSYIQELAHYWEKEYDWRKAEAHINSFANYEMEVNGIELHFVHERSSDPNAIPLIFSHGWPGSFIEAFKMIRKLTDPGENGGKKQAFHVIVPSLPGYGFSSAPTKPGFGVGEIAKTFHELMLKLGYNKYVAQGGDWGSAITTALGGMYPQHCRAIHINMCFARPSYTNPWHLAQIANAKLPIANWFPVAISYQEMANLQAAQDFQTFETGYSKIHSTKPQTLGYALTDSPVGLMAWIVEKFRTWSDCGGDVESRFSKDELLTNVAIYWFNRNIVSSMRLYYESMGPYAPPAQSWLRHCVTVPSAIANFPKELYCAPKAWAATKYNLKQWSKFQKGGHFAALEEPDLLADDVIKFFSKYH